MPEITPPESGITPQELLTTNDILDDDILIITHNAGDSETISGADLNKRIQTIIATTKTITGAPLKTSNIVRVMFIQAITALDTTTPLVINYNGTDYAVKVGKDGALENFCAYEVSTGVYRYLQAYTSLEMVYDGTQFIIVGNPVVISDTDYVVYADGDKILKYKQIDNAPTASSNNPVKSGGINTAITNATKQCSKGGSISHSNNYYAKLTVTIDLLYGSYTSTLIALQNRGGATCLVVVGANDSGNAHVYLIQKISGAYTPSFYYKVINNSTAEFYWLSSAYDNNSNYQILTNNSNTTVTTGSVQTLPSGTTQL